MKKQESQLQIQCVKWFRLQYPKYILFSVPNGGSRNVLEAMRLKREGVMAGVSDLIVIAPSKILFIELKFGKGKQSENQINFENKIKELGFNYFLAYCFDDFKNIIKNSL